jgi:carboxylate-amine ligase
MALPAAPAKQKCAMTHSQYAFGLEEEFFLSRADTGVLAIDVARLLLDEARAELGDCVTSEMLQSQIEIASPIFSHVDEAHYTMGRLRQALGNIAACMGLNIISAGTHPLGVWQEQLVVDELRYEQLMADFRIVGHRNLVCGLHVHVSVPSCVDRVELMNRLMRWLPLLLALSTSSPFWNARITGLLSYRQALYDEWPRSGIPDFFENETDYAAFADRMARAGAIRDSRDLWWAIRPALRYPTLELRIADSCTYVRDSVAIATLFRCLVAATVRRPRFGTRQTTHTRRIIDENRWRAKRDGIHAQFIAEASSEAHSVAQVLDDALTFVSDEAQNLQCAHVVESLRAILQRGTSAHRQLRIYNERRAAGLSRTDALRHVLLWLETATLEKVAVGNQHEPASEHMPSASTNLIADT